MNHCRITTNHRPVQSYFQSHWSRFRCWKSRPPVLTTATPSPTPKLDTVLLVYKNQTRDEMTEELPIHSFILFRRVSAGTPTAHSWWAIQRAPSRGQGPRALGLLLQEMQHHLYQHGVAIAHSRPHLPPDLLSLSLSLQLCRWLRCTGRSGNHRSRATLTPTEIK